MSKMASFQAIAVSARPYTKIIMHAVKHPQNSVQGILLGVIKSGKVCCVDVLPLVHTHALHPQLKLGYEIAQELCVDPSKNDAKKGLQILGFYICTLESAGEISDNVETSCLDHPQINMIAQVVQKELSSPIMCTVNTSVIAQAGNALSFFEFNASSWKKVSSEKISVSSHARKLATLSIADGTFTSLVDLDDHLWDSNLSPLNGSIFSGYETILQQDLDDLKKNEFSFAELEQSCTDKS